MQGLANIQCSFYTGARLQGARAQPARQAAAKQCIVAKAKTKASDFRRLTDEQIDEHVEDAQISLYHDFRSLQRQSRVSLHYAELQLPSDLIWTSNVLYVVFADKAKTPVEVGSRD